MVRDGGCVKALTICQPYAHLIVTAKEKRVENRNWPTCYRGPLLIHAGKSGAWLEPGEAAEFSRDGTPLVFGAIVGAAELVDCVKIESIEAGKFDIRFPDLITRAHCGGPWCWILAKRVAFLEPISYRGQQGLFDVPDAVVADQIRAFKAARARTAT